MPNNGLTQLGLLTLKGLVQLAKLSNKIVVGITGQFGSGCTMLGEHLNTDKGFKHYKFRDIIEQAAIKRLTKRVWDQLDKTKRRKELQTQGNILREKKASTVAKAILDEINRNSDDEKDIVIETIRNPAEIELFKAKFGERFFLISLYSSAQVRFQRKKDEYGDNLEQFKEDDLRDKGDDEPKYGQKTERCVYGADISIDNEAKLISRTEWDTFFTKISKYIELIRQPGMARPTYEELHMREAYAISLKSSCFKRQVGAVIVNDLEEEVKQKVEEVKQKGKTLERRESYVVATGFNDVPVGTLECRELEPYSCHKDAEEEKKLREMKYCPRCGKKLKLPSEKAVPYVCPTNKCKARLPRDFIPGKMLDVCRAVHAEEAAILQAAKLGSTSLNHTSIYTTTFPCLLCAKSIINSGIKRVIFHEPYPMKESYEILDSKVTLKKFEGVNAWAFDRLYRATNDND